MINAMHHIAISTPDLDRAIAFYCDVLGFQERFEFEWDKGSREADRVVGLEDSSARMAMLWTGNTHIEFFEYRNPVPKERDAEARACDHGLTHICLDVTDIDAEYERLKEAGVEFNAPPQAISGVRTTYGKDPDGNILEIQEVLDWPDMAMPKEIERVPKRVIPSA